MTRSPGAPARGCSRVLLEEDAMLLGGPEHQQETGDEEIKYHHKNGGGDYGLRRRKAHSASSAFGLQATETANRPDHEAKYHRLHQSAHDFTKSQVLIGARPILVGVHA